MSGVVRLPVGPIMPVVLVADPPWKFNDPLPGKKRGASKHYACLTLEELKLYPLPPQVIAAPDAVLFMWRVASMQEEALALMRAWGFRQYGEIVWQKLTKRGRKHFGMGHIVRNSHETCLVAVRGDRIRPAVRNVRSTFDGRTGSHSEKPAEFYRLVERLYPQAHRYEIFARRPRPGWAQYGNEFGKFAPEQLALGGGKHDHEFAEKRGRGAAQLYAVS